MSTLNKISLVVLIGLLSALGYLKWRNNSLSAKVDALNQTVKEKQETILQQEHNITQLKTEIRVNNALIEEYKRSDEKQQVEIQALEEANKVTERKLVHALDKEGWSEQKVPASVLAAWSSSN